MRVVLQRVLEATVKIEDKLQAKIGKGLLVLLGVEEADSVEDIEWLCNKIVGLRIFSDENGKMNLSVKDIDGDIIVVSQFTLHANIKKGTRPSFIKAAKPKKAVPMYEAFIEQIQKVLGKTVGTGQFGADMQVALINDGPVTIIIDSKQRNF